jgi:hypothetical protein
VWELDHLAVGAAGDVRRLLEPGVLVLADEFDALGELRRRAVAGDLLGRCVALFRCLCDGRSSSS